MQIITRKVGHIYDRKWPTEYKALEDVSTEFNQGEFVTIIGHTGSGKTTFIEHLNALSTPTSGEVELRYHVRRQRLLRRGEYYELDEVKLIKANQRRVRRVKEIRARVGIAFQFAEYQLFEETVLKDIMFGPLTMRVPKAEAIALAKKYINVVGLDESYLARSPFALSGGQKRRVALAGILAMNPDFLVLDEPVAGLDPQGTKDMYAIFQKIHAEGKTLIIVTHNLDHVLEFSERTLMFRHGRLIRNELSPKLMYDVDFLVSNELIPPKLTTLVKKLEAHGKVIGEVRSIEALIAALTPPELAKKVTPKRGRHE